MSEIIELERELEITVNCADCEAELEIISAVLQGRFDGVVVHCNSCELCSDKARDEGRSDGEESDYERGKEEGYTEGFEDGSEGRI